MAKQQPPTPCLTSFIWELTQSLFPLTKLVINKDKTEVGDGHAT